MVSLKLTCPQIAVSLGVLADCTGTDNNKTWKSTIIVTKQKNCWGIDGLL